MGAFARLREGFCEVGAPIRRRSERVGMADERLRGPLGVLVLLGGSRCGRHSAAMIPSPERSQRTRSA